MLLPDNEALDKALKSGQERNFSKFSLVFDWERTGRYDNQFSDLSDNVISVELDAQFTGNYPTELEINDGYAQRRLTVELGGEVNGVHVVKFFSPFSNEWGGQIGAVNTPANFSVFVDTEQGDVEIQQFAGYMIQASPSRATGTVEVELADITSQLTNGMSFKPSARSQTLAQWGQSYPNTVNERVRQRGGNSLSWYMIDACRKSGLYQGPKPPKESIAYWTLTGGVLPEIGGMEQMPRDGRQSWPISKGSWIMSAYQQLMNERPQYAQSFDYDTDYPTKPWSPNINTPSTYPRYMWEKGPYGPVMLRDVYEPDVSSLSSVADAMRFTGTTTQPIKINPTSGKSVRVAMGGWINIDKTCHESNLTEVSTVLTGLAAISEVQPQDVNRSVVYGPTSWLTFSAHPRTGQLEVYLTFENASGGTGKMEWKIDWTPSMTDGWHYIATSVEFPSGNTSPTVRFKIDDTVSTRSWNTGNSFRFPTGYSTYYVNPDGRTIETSGVYLTTSGGTQHWGVWYQPGVSSGDAVVWSNGPDCLDYEVGTDIGPSMARVMWTPKVDGKTAWEVIQSIGSSDLGVVYVDEYGIVRYSNWEDIILTRDKGEIISYLTLDDVKDIDPFTTFDSVVNEVSYNSQDRWAVDTCVFEATDPEQFVVAAGRTAMWKFAIDDTMSVLPGPLTPRRLSQGYASTTAGSGDNPTGQYTPVDFMRAYPPEKWKNGYEGHNHGDVVGGGGLEHPPEGIGMWAWATAGWEEGDTDPTHLTVFWQSQNSLKGKPTMAAVDDNTPFLKIRGYKLESNDQYTEMVTASDPDSFASFGNRHIDRPSTDWTTDYYTQYDLSQKLADDLCWPRPVFESVEMIGDPRRQLQDVIGITDPELMGGPIFGTVVGINRKYSISEGCTESLTMRAVLNRKALWLLGMPSNSILGETTALGEPL